ncbi:MAG: integration host factor subunit beta [Deltaproteobacteria bacterium]|nr:integration host factor subunit beta [Deltaproteobacteria bacterium]
MNKSELVDIVAGRVQNLSHKDVDMIIETVFDKMVEALAKGNRIEIRGFGSFEIRSRPARNGRNPKSGESVFVGSRRIPFFKVGKELKERINQDDAPAKA